MSAPHYLPVIKIRWIPYFTSFGSCAPYLLRLTAPADPPFVGSIFTSSDGSATVVFVVHSLWYTAAAAGGWGEVLSCVVQIVSAAVMDIRNFFSKKGPGAAASPAVQPPPSKKAPENKEDAKNEDSSTKRRRGAPEAKSSASGTSSLKPEAGKKTSTTQSKTTRLLIIDDEEDDIEKVKGGSRNGRPVVPISGIKVSSSMAEEEGGIRPKRGLAPSVAPSNGTVEPNNNTKKKKPKHVHDEDIFLDDSDDDFETSRPTFKNLPDSSNWVAQTKKAGQPAATPNAKQESPLRLRSSPRLQSPASTAPLLGSTSTSSTRARPSIASNSKPIQKKNTASASAASITALPRPAVGAVQPRNAFDVDSAAPQCLVGCTFCFTGIMTDLPSRDDAVELIKVLGGRVTGNVSGKTDYLVLGQVLEDGRSTEEGSKYKRAVTESNVALINGAFELYGLLQYYSDAKHKNCTNSKNGIDDGKRSAMNTSTNSTAVKPNDVNTTTNVPAPVPQNPYAMTVAANPYAKTANTSLQRTGGNPYASKPSATTSASNTKPDKKVKMPFRETGPKINVLWVDKYKPVRSSEILGNQDAVRKLSVWLNTWEDRFISNSTVKSFSSPNGPWKAALLSGPPGIGSRYKEIHADLSGSMFDPVY